MNDIIDASMDYSTGELKIKLSEDFTGSIGSKIQIVETVAREIAFDFKEAYRASSIETPFFAGHLPGDQWHSGEVDYFDFFSIGNTFLGIDLNRWDRLGLIDNRVVEIKDAFDGSVLFTSDLDIDLLDTCIDTGQTVAFTEVGSPQIRPNSFVLSSDGLTMLITGEGDSTYIHEYKMSTPFDLDTAVFSNNSLLINPSIPTATAFITISDDGLILLIAVNPTSPNGDAYIMQYDLSSPFDISTAVDSGNRIYPIQLPGFPTPGVDNLYGIKLNTAKDKIIVGNSFDDILFALDLSTSGDLSTATYNGEIFDLIGAFGVQVTSDFEIDHTGVKLWISGHEFVFNTAWDLSTLIDNGVVFNNPNSNVAIFRSVAFSSIFDLFVGDFQSQAIYRYSLEGMSNIGAELTVPGTNHLRWSEDLSHAAWEPSNGVVVEDSFILHFSNIGGFPLIKQDLPLTFSNIDSPVTVSCECKGNTDDVIRLLILKNDVVVAVQLITLTEKFKRYSVTTVMDSAVDIFSIAIDAAGLDVSAKVVNLQVDALAEATEYCPTFNFRAGSPFGRSNALLFTDTTKFNTTKTFPSDLTAYIVTSSNNTYKPNTPRNIIGNGEALVPGAIVFTHSTVTDSIYTFNDMPLDAAVGSSYSRLVYERGVTQEFKHVGKNVDSLVDDVNVGGVEIPGITLGATSNNSAFVGYVGNVVIFDKVLNNTEQEVTESELIRRNSITL